MFNRPPPVTSTILLISISLSLLTALDLTNEHILLFQKNAILKNFEFWRIFTCQFYMGDLGIHSFWSVFILKSYLEYIEEELYTQKHVLISRLLFISFFLGIVNLITSNSPSLTYSFTTAINYIWSRVYGQEVTFLLLPIKASYLPWILLIFGITSGHSIVEQLTGIAAGHIIYYTDVVKPSTLTKKTS